MNQSVETKRRLYLDHAATSWPKSDAVQEAMESFGRNNGATAGRGVYASSLSAGEVVLHARRSVAKLINAESSQDISLHASGTLALNVGILGLLRPGDHVVTTKADHNSVLRVLAHQSTSRNVTFTSVDCNANGDVSAQDVVAAVNDRTRLVAVTHASNVTGAVLPVAEIAASLKHHQAAFMVDAAQTMGHMPIDVATAGIDLLAAPGHKAIGGPLGTAFLYVAPPWHDAIEPIIFGGTGSQSESIDMPTQMPGKLEAGNLNIPAIAGLRVAVDECLSREFDDRGLRQAQRIHRGLAAISAVQIVGTANPIPVVSFRVDGLPAADCASILDAEFGIEVRSGLHCAAMIHEPLGTLPDGTVRVSCGHGTSDADLDRFVAAVRSICE